MKFQHILRHYRKRRGSAAAQVQEMRQENIKANHLQCLSSGQWVQNKNDDISWTCRKSWALAPPSGHKSLNNNSERQRFIFEGEQRRDVSLKLAHEYRLLQHRRIKREGFAVAVETSGSILGASHSKAGLIGLNIQSKNISIVLFLCLGTVLSANMWNRDPFGFEMPELVSPALSR